MCAASRSDICVCSGPVAYRKRRSRQFICSSVVRDLGAVDPVRPVYDVVLSRQVRPVDNDILPYFFKSDGQQFPVAQKVRVPAVVFFGAVVVAVTVGIAGDGLRRGRVFLSVVQPVEVTIQGTVRGKRIKSVSHLPSVGHRVVVRVCVIGVRVGSVFVKVRQAVMVGVECGVVGKRVQSLRHFPAVLHPIVIGIFVLGVRVIDHLLDVGQTVIVRVGVGVRHVGVRAVGRLPVVGHPVRIAIKELHLEQPRRHHIWKPGRGVEARHPLVALEYLAVARVVNRLDEVGYAVRKGQRSFPSRG